MTKLLKGIFYICLSSTSKRYSHENFTECKIPIISTLYSWKSDIYQNLNKQTENIGPANNQFSHFFRQKLPHNHCSCSFMHTESNLANLILEMRSNYLKSHINEKVRSFKLFQIVFSKVVFECQLRTEAVDKFIDWRDQVNLLVYVPDRPYFKHKQKNDITKFLPTAFFKINFLLFCWFRLAEKNFWWIQLHFFLSHVIGDLVRTQNYSLMRTCTCAYQGIRNLSFSENLRTY